MTHVVEGLDALDEELLPLRLGALVEPVDERVVRDQLALPEDLYEQTKGSSAEHVSQEARLAALGKR